jgi:DNA-binding Lrp family transcriptional regulator
VTRDPGRGSPTRTPGTDRLSVVLGDLGLVPGLPLSIPAGRNGSVLAEVDRALIRILQVDGRRSFAAIGRDLGMPERAVRKRVNELLDSHVIQITSVTDPVALGYRGSAMIGISLDGQRPRQHVIKQLLELPGVDYAIATTGRYDLLAEILCADARELIEVVDENISGATGVSGVEIFPYLQLHYQEPAWDVAQTKTDPASTEPRAPLDVTDRKIIAALSDDGRAPFSTVADIIGVSESLVRKRVTRLIDSGTIRLTAIVNPRSLGFEIVAWLAIRALPGRSLLGVSEALAALPSITYIAVTGGRFDVLAEMVCHDTTDVLDKLESQIRTIDGIGEIELMIGRDLYYRSVEPIRPDRD